MGFLEFIFWCIVVVYALGLAGRLLLRWYVRRKQREFAERVDTQQKRQGRRPEGQVTVRQTGRREKHVNRSVGEYVEYEEVQEEDRK